MAEEPINRPRPTPMTPEEAAARRAARPARGMPLSEMVRTQIENTTAYAEVQSQILEALAAQTALLERIAVALENANSR